LGEHQLDKLGVTGSSPVTPIPGRVLEKGELCVAIGEPVGDPSLARRRRRCSVSATAATAPELFSATSVGEK
jgi:hypothetical protein